MPASPSLQEFDVFPWNKNFETGHPEIDKQHKVLVKLLNKLANTLTHNDPASVNQAFEELAQYADYHFESEEAIWFEYFKEDSSFDSHQLRHASFLPKVLELKEREAHEPLDKVVEDIVKFLIRWLAFHIIDDDKRFAITVNAIDSGSTLEEAKVISDRKMSGSTRVLIETVMTMYDGLSSRTLDLMRERNARLKIETELREANKKLEKLSITNQLTGLYNRRHFDHVLREEHQRARRDGKLLTLISFDIDYFKKLNDYYGHSAGDEALKKVGDRLKSICRRSSDFAFRTGGEEFAIISTSGESADSAEAFAESIRKNIEGLTIPNENSKVSEYMTVSVGVAVTRPNDINDVNTLLKTADRRLYAAKHSGRNIVVAMDKETSLEAG